MARRKRLLGLEALAKGNELLDLGVPLTKVHEVLGLQGKWSYPSTVTVFNADRAGLHKVTRPAWLTDAPTLQETPDDWEFIGVFPNGDWVQK